MVTVSTHAYSSLSYLRYWYKRDHDILIHQILFAHAIQRWHNDMVLLVWRQWTRIYHNYRKSLCKMVKLEELSLSSGMQPYTPINWAFSVYYLKFCCYVTRTCTPFSLLIVKTKYIKTCVSYVVNLTIDRFSFK